MKANLIIYELSKLDQYHKVLANRALFGYTDNSNGCRYKYKRKGILAGIKHFRLPSGAVIVKNKDQKMISSILNKHKVRHKIFEINIKSSMLH